MTTPSPSDLAVLFADVSGSTRLYEELGDAQALSTIARCLALVKDASDGYQGRLVKTIGDEAMVVFPAADNAAQAAAEIQGRVAEGPVVGSQRLALRMGFHFGPAIEAGGDIFGDSVNLAARLVSLAKREQVIMSEETAAQLSPWLRARTRELDTLTVRGKLRDIRIFELLWQDAPEDLTSLATRPINAPARLRLRHREREIEMNDDHPTVTLGRDAQNDVVVSDRLASRLHARIERRSGKFVLVDHSSNGTYVRIEDEAQLQLRREELTLRGHGQMIFGHSGAEEAGDIVSFECNA